MILLFNKNRPVEFSKPRHLIHRIAFSALQEIKNRLFFTAGSGLVGNNLLKELTAAKELHWAQGYRDLPRDAHADLLWVVRGVGDLQWALRHKKKLGARELWAGPNIVAVPSERSGIIGAEEIDRCLVPCEWVKDFYAQQAPELARRLLVWPVGIDSDYWRPSAENKEYLLIYNKAPMPILKTLCDQLTSIGCAFRVIQYGRYQVHEYRTLLQRAWGMVWLSESESEGLALMEALSMNVPALAWDPGQRTYTSRELNRTFSFTTSSAPYFDDTCGLLFKRIDDFKDGLRQFQQRLASYQPREFLKRNNLTLSTNLSRLPLAHL